MITRVWTSRAGAPVAEQSAFVGGLDDRTVEHLVVLLEGHEIMCSAAATIRGTVARNLLKWSRGLAVARIAVGRSHAFGENPGQELDYSGVLAGRRIVDCMVGEHRTVHGEGGSYPPLISLLALAAVRTSRQADLRRGACRRS